MSAWATRYSPFPSLAPKTPFDEKAAPPHGSTKLHIPRAPSCAIVTESFSPVLSTGNPELAALYPDWSEIDLPKASWLHEPVEREDYGRLPIESIKELAHVSFTPAYQDQKFEMEWLPFGVDTHVFKPDWNVRKEFDAAFIGLMYPKRTQFMQALRPHLRGIEILHCDIQVKALGGVRMRDSALLYADNLRRIKVLVNLPTLSQHTVTTVYEVLACGTFLITPAIAEHHNFDNVQAHFDLPARPDQLAEGIRFCLEHEEERDQATRACCEQVHRLHKLESRCEVLVGALQGNLCGR